MYVAKERDRERGEKRGEKGRGNTSREARYNTRGEIIQHVLEINFNKDGAIPLA